MKHKKLFALLALVMTAMTASADHEPAFKITEASGISAHGSVTYKVNDTETTPEGGVIKVDENDVITVTIIPDEGWTSTPSGQWSAAIAAARNRASEVDMLKDITFASAGTNTWTFIMQRANAEISATYRKLLTNTDITIEDLADMTYTGKALKPAVTVTDGSTPLVLGTDYTVSYSNNVNAGKATVTITGIGNYAGTVKKSFAIINAEGKVVFSPWSITKTYGDPNFTHTPIVTGTGTLTYSSNNESIATVDASTGEVTIKAVGKVWITAAFVGSNYTDASDAYLITVEPKPVDYEGGDITQHENGYTVNLTEDASNPNPNPLPNDEDLVELTYSRTLTAPGSSEGDVTIDDQPANLYTICLPFAPETGDAAKYYTLSSVSGETLNFDEVAAPVANTPYLVAVTGNVNFIESCTDQDVASMTINSSTVDGYTFNGTFTGMTNADAQGKYILQSGNKWGKVTAENNKAFIPPFRAFIEGPASGARLLSGSIDGSDGNATGIKYIRTQDIDGTERYFDLNGRRIEKPATKGIYIHNGRKEVLK
ncbi:MAG: Ig-like domain-containing protein [Muribaculaceae bacterium]|nr:Ig-like domain-containing protein [Muribaculaceae bacterium]